eukprot:1303669-Pleurochrysis_carterae.AAC.5
MIGKAKKEFKKQAVPDVYVGMLTLQLSSSAGEDAPVVTLVTAQASTGTNAGSAADANASTPFSVTRAACVHNDSRRCATFRRTHMHAAVEAPDARRRVPRRRDDVLSVGRYAHRLHRIALTLERAQLRAFRAGPRARRLNC